MTALLINGHRRSLSGKSVEAFLKTIPTNKIKEIVINPTSSAGDLASENGSVNIILGYTRTFNLPELITAPVENADELIRHSRNNKQTVRWERK